MGFLDVKRVAIGSERTRGMAQVVERLLRDRGVPAFVEMSAGYSLYSDIVFTRIFVEIALLKEEHMPIIREVLGARIADENVRDLEAHFREMRGERYMPPTETPAVAFEEERAEQEPAAAVEVREQAAEIVIARFTDAIDVNLYYDLLKRKKFACKAVAANSGYELVLLSPKVTTRELQILREYLGNLLIESGLEISNGNQ